MSSNAPSLWTACAAVLLGLTSAVVCALALTAHPKPTRAAAAPELVSVSELANTMCPVPSKWWQPEHIAQR